MVIYIFESTLPFLLVFTLPQVDFAVFDFFLEDYSVLCTLLKSRERKKTPVLTKTKELSNQRHVYKSKDFHRRYPSRKTISFYLHHLLALVINILNLVSFAVIALHVGNMKHAMNTSLGLY